MCEKRREKLAWQYDLNIYHFVVASVLNDVFAFVLKTRIQTKTCNLFATLVEVWRRIAVFSMDTTCSNTAVHY